MDEEPKAKKEGLRVIARLIARIAHAIVSEYRELDMEPEKEKQPFGFTIGS